MMLDYETCRFCKYYDKGTCIRLSEDVDSNEMAIRQFVEEGYLSEAVKEGFGNKDADPELIEDICDNIETALLNKFNYDPNIHVDIDFKCKHFW